MEQLSLGMFGTSRKENEHRLPIHPLHLNRIDANSATWEISEALIPHLRTVMDGPGAWDRDQTIGWAIQIRDGVIRNPKIVSFQRRSAEFPHTPM